MASNLTEPQQKSGDDCSARRRLIKGSFAAPAALTLCSGSALAAATSPLTCLGKDIAAQPSKPLGPVATVPAGDTWVRVRAWVEVNKNYSFIKASDVSMVGFSNTTPFITGSQAICVVTGNSYDFGTVYPSGSKMVPTDLTQTGNYYAVLMDSSGRVAGISSVNPKSLSTGPVHGSCWSSFN